MLLIWGAPSCCHSPCRGGRTREIPDSLGRCTGTTRQGRASSLFLRCQRWAMTKGIIHGGIEVVQENTGIRREDTCRGLCQNEVLLPVRPRTDRNYLM